MPARVPLQHQGQLRHSFLSGLENLVSYPLPVLNKGLHRLKANPLLTNEL